MGGGKFLQYIQSEVLYLVFLLAQYDKKMYFVISLIFGAINV